MTPTDLEARLRAVLPHMRRGIDAIPELIEEAADLIAALRAQQGERHTVIEQCARLCEARAKTHLSKGGYAARVSKHTEAMECAAAIRELEGVGIPQSIRALAQQTVHSGEEVGR